MFEWIKFFIVAILMISGLFIAYASVYGVFRFQYVLNRIHAAAIMDTLVVGLIMSGLMIYLGFTMVTLKVCFILIFLWLSSPVTSHLISKLEVTKNFKKVEQECEVEER